MGIPGFALFAATDASRDRDKGWDAAFLRSVLACLLSLAKAEDLSKQADSLTVMLVATSKIKQERWRGKLTVRLSLTIHHQYHVAGEPSKESHLPKRTQPGKSHRVCNEINSRKEGRTKSP